MGACASARLTPEIATAAASSLFLLSPRDSGPPRAQSLSGEGRQQPRKWGRPSPLPLLCLSLAVCLHSWAQVPMGKKGTSAKVSMYPGPPAGLCPRAPPLPVPRGRTLRFGSPRRPQEVRSLQTPLPHLQEDRTGQFGAAAGAPPPSLTDSLEAARTTPVHVGWCLTSRAWCGQQPFSEA